MLFEFPLKNGTLRIRISAPMVLIIWAILTGHVLLAAANLDSGFEASAIARRILASPQAADDLTAKPGPAGRRLSRHTDSSKGAVPPSVKGKKGIME